MPDVSLYSHVADGCGICPDRHATRLNPEGARVAQEGLKSVTTADSYVSLGEVRRSDAEHVRRNCGNTASATHF